MRSWPFLLLALYVLGLEGAQAAPTLRIGTFNAAMNRSRAGLLLEDLKNPQRSSSRQIARVAEIIQIVRPEILFVNEFDQDANGDGLTLFQHNFLAVSQNGNDPIDYPFRYAAESNTGIASGHDLDNNRQVGTTPGSNAYAGDAFGFGSFPGQYGMALFSQHPIDEAAIRTFQTFLWQDMPGALIPNGTNNHPKWYSAEESAILRLSSKSHWDVPVRVGGELIHLLVSHPTPPVFDGSEDRNGRRNHDEIRLWADYIDPDKAAYLYDDNGLLGGLPANARFIILGDLNADPNGGDSYPGAIQQLLDHPLVNSSITPGSPGNAQATAAFRAGNLRADYALPSKSGWKIENAAVFWPENSGSISNTVRGASDHRLVYIDLTLTRMGTPPPIRELSLRRNAETVELRWKAVAGYDYQVRWSNDLKKPWQAEPQSNITFDNGQAVAVDKAAAGTTRRFYSVTAQKNP